MRIRERNNDGTLGGFIDLPVELTLGQAKQKKIQELNKACYTAITQDFKSSCLGEEHLYGFDEIDQMNLNGMLTAISTGIADEVILWKTNDAGIFGHTHDQFKQLCKDALNHKQEKMFRCIELKEQVIQCSSLEEINNINF